MTKTNFYLFLNTLNILLLGLLYACFSIIADFISDTSLKNDILALYVLFILGLSKIVLLPLLLFLFDKIFKSSIIVRFLTVLKDDDNRRKNVIHNAIFYDVLGILFMLILSGLYDYSAIIGVPMFYELITVGGIFLFYPMLLYILKNKQWL